MADPLLSARMAALRQSKVGRAPFQKAAPAAPSQAVPGRSDNPQAAAALAQAKGGLSKFISLESDAVDKGKAAEALRLLGSISA